MLFQKICNPPADKLFRTAHTNLVRLYPDAATRSGMMHNGMRLSLNGDGAARQEGGGLLQSRQAFCDPVFLDFEKLHSLCSRKPGGECDRHGLSARVNPEGEPSRPAGGFPDDGHVAVRSELNEIRRLRRRREVGAGGYGSTPLRTWSWLFRAYRHGCGGPKAACARWVF